MNYAAVCMFHNCKCFWQTRTDFFVADGAFRSRRNTQKFVNLLNELVRETFFDVCYVCWTFLWFQEFFSASIFHIKKLFINKSQMKNLLISHPSRQQLKIRANQLMISFAWLGWILSCLFFFSRRPRECVFSWTFRSRFEGKHNS